ncbi:unnamed protein product [Mycetohabitans rhizoxinica HKI 454]|uniref:Uncharacterized protein n=1 Tax=Mycetohabitans rhizoxinica (strain DSM 19002 / CIP 109453 / HKI 454) TaxID=882378 RepID=E5AKT6_MYCRK|nr:unnamed protein product [Mycetohabitans rhizoxinica HKI 454]
MCFRLKNAFLTLAPGKPGALMARVVSTHVRRVLIIWTGEDYFKNPNFL